MARTAPTSPVTMRPNSWPSDRPTAITPTFTCRESLNNLSFSFSLFDYATISVTLNRSRYRHSIRIELVGSKDLPGPIGCESWVQHSDTPFEEDDAYFHAHFAYQPKLKFPWEPAIFTPPGGWHGPGQVRFRSNLQSSSGVADQGHSSPCRSDYFASLLRLV